ncbi:MAG: hypothetical protein HY295_05895 [Thaumarchaeota archaeon]|nr:hypothetical protein [Nitrososphaerota archaeon]
MSDDDEIYNTEFGPIDGGTRRIAGYLIMALFTIIGLGASYQMLTTPPAPLVDESFYTPYPSSNPYISQYL